MILTILNDKTLKPKERIEALSARLLDGRINIGELVSVACEARDSLKAGCIEAMEFATKQQPSVINSDGFRFAVQCLGEKAPRVKWESAKVIGNTAHLYPDNLEEAIKNLLDNAAHPGTVVRWSAAFALGEILKLRTKYNKDLMPAIESICSHEEKNSIRNIYLAAIKKSVLR